MSTAEFKMERSIPVQSRVDIKTLAEMDMYWESIGVKIRSMSQLLSWSVDLCHSILEKSSMLPERLGSVAECHEYMESRGLYQRSMKKRAIAKINAAMRFENLRIDGIDPEEYDRREYNIVHNRSSVVPYSPKRRGRVSDERYKKAMGGYSREDIKRIDRELQKKREEEKRAKRASRKPKDNTPIFDPTKMQGKSYGKKILKDGIVVDVDENLRKMKEADEKLKDM